MNTILLLTLLGLAADAPDAADAAPDPNHPTALEGTVRDQAGRPLADVAVVIDGDQRTQTDGRGGFVARDLPPGRHVVTLFGPGGEELTEAVTVPAGRTLRRGFVLGAAQVSTINIVQKPRPEKVEVSEVTLSHDEVATVPGTFGDPVRVVENLPGMSRAPGGMGGALIVRGANPADTGVFIDGVQIPLLYHFGGLTSVVNSEFLSSVDFQPGGFGVEHGRATAGVVEVESRRPSCDRVHGSASVDPLDAELFACVPVGRWRLMAAGRRSYVDAFLPGLLAAAAGDGETPTLVSPAYFDYQAKAETARAYQRFELFAFGSRDTLKVSRAPSAEDVDMHLGGAIAFHRLLARHTYYAGDRLVIRSSLTPGLLSQDVGDSSQDTGTQHHSHVDIYTAEWRETATWRWSDRLTLRGGLDHVLSHWNADFVTDLPNLGRRYPTPLPFDENVQEPWRHGNTGVDQAYWAELGLHLDALTVTPGVRVSHLVFDETRRLVVEPRLGARWEAGEGTTLTASAGLYRKLPDPLSGVTVEGFGQPALLAERALHLVTGIEQRLGALETRVQGFYVRRDELPSPTSDVEVRDGKAQPVLFRSDGRGRSYGLELLLRLPAAEHRRVSGWVAYTLSRSVRIDRAPDGEGFGKYAGLDPGTPRLGDVQSSSAEYLSPYDQTHILTAVGRWELPWKMSAGFRFQLVSGNPTTPLDHGQTFYDADSDRYGVSAGSVARNSGRLPAFHRLDVRLDKRWDFSRWSLTAYLEVINAYNRRPVEAVGYDYRYQTRTELRGLPVLPLLGLKGEI
jgi:hypothetical protein